MEVKPPVPQIPPPVWSDFKDLQEWEKYHQERATDDKTSSALASIARSQPAMAIIVAMFGAIMPAPLATPATLNPPSQRSPASLG